VLVINSTANKLIGCISPDAIVQILFCSILRLLIHFNPINNKQQDENFSPVPFSVQLHKLKSLYKYNFTNKTGLPKTALE